MLSGPDIETAYDDIFGQFLAAWSANTPAVTGGVAPVIVWPDEPDTTLLREGSAPWCRITVKHGRRRSTTIQYQGRVESQGLVMVNIFVPAGKQGLAYAARLGKVAVAAFEGQRAGDVWFTDVVPEEVGVDGTWLQFNVKATFHYSNQL